MIPKIRVFAKSGTKAYFGGGYDRDQMFYEISEIDFYNKTVAVWGCHRKDCGMCDDTYKMEDVEIMMSTGLKDRDGIEIFEGDIVKRTYLFNGAYGETHTGEVVYDKEYARYVISRPYKYTEPKTEDLGNILSDKSVYEVIGNIYENPELWEVG